MAPISKNLGLIERCLEVFVRNQQKIGMGSDEVSYVAGFMAAFGVLSGRLNPPGMTDATSIADRFASVEREIINMRNSVVVANDEEHRNGG